MQLPEMRKSQSADTQRQVKTQIKLIPQLSSIHVTEQKGRSVRYVLHVEADNGVTYLAKPWHANRVLNFANQLRGIAAIETARFIGIEALPRVAILTGIPEACVEILGIERLSDPVDFHRATPEQQAVVANPDDLIRVIYHDLFCLYNDRRADNSNLIISNNIAFMVDFDNYFTGAEQYQEAKRIREDVLAGHPLSDGLRNRGTKPVAIIANASDRAAAMTDEWLDSLRAGIPARWFAEGGGADVWGLLRQARGEAIEVGNQILQCVR